MVEKQTFPQKRLIFFQEYILQPEIYFNFSILVFVAYL